MHSIYIICFLFVHQVVLFTNNLKNITEIFGEQVCYIYGNTINKPFITSLQITV